MQWWDPWREQRGWARENKHVPLSQFRGIVERDLFWQNPKKQRWAKRRLWWLDNRGWLITVLIAIVGVVGTYLNFFRK
jgi:hypothetical protein